MFPEEDKYNELPIYSVLITFINITELCQSDEMRPLQFNCVFYCNLSYHWKLSDVLTNINLTINLQLKYFIRNNISISYTAKSFSLIEIFEA